MFKRSKNFTLIELLVVVGIIGILAAIALPNFHSVQTRAKVSSAASNIRVLAGGAEAYRVDWNGYPPMAQKLPEDPYGILSDIQLRVLTTPISYVSGSAFRDPFGKIQSHSIFSGFSFSTDRNDFPIPGIPNPKKSLLYYNYQYFAKWTNNPLIEVPGLSLISIGPDRKDSFGAFRPFSSEALPPLARQAGINDTHDTQYDPTNGTISGGDIFGFAGEVGAFPH
jgi:prepilin-type N-terminal cleavage/methylation domain-containing protein